MAGSIQASASALRTNPTSPNRTQSFPIGSNSIRASCALSGFPTPSRPIMWIGDSALPPCMESTTVGRPRKGGSAASFSSTTISTGLIQSKRMPCYITHVAKGMVIKVGRYISPPDIEAQLAPDNYLYTHSLMFTVDCYTQTGLSAAIKLNDQWSVLFGIHAGDDIAPWNAAAHPTGMAMVRWVSKSNNDSLFGGIDSINNGKFKPAHDNLQQFNLTWTHRFNETGTFLTTTEAYYIYQSHALVGGTVNNGPGHAWVENVGGGAPIPRNAPAIGLVNYTEWKFSKKDFLSLRPLDILVDKKGERTGFPTTYESWTVGVTHRFNQLISSRPEVRYEYAYSARPYDNGTRKGQLMFAIDTILRF